jgi:multidrug efflux pump subunit AcrA (membrane-fusion protein)
MAAPTNSFYARAVALRGLLCCRWRLLLLICAIGAAAGFTTARSGDANGLQSRLLTVQPSRFRITRECSGLIEPVTTSVVQSGCHWTVSILSLVPEGTEVQAGDVVCVLRSREISLIRANAAVTASLKSEELQRTAAERRLSDAQFALQSAEMDLQQYVHGTHPKQVDKLDRDLQLAETQKQSAEDEYAFTRRMWMTGVANRSEVDAAGMALTNRSVQAGRLAGQKELLQKFTDPRTRRRLEYNVDHLKLNLARTDLANSLAETRYRMISLSDQRRLDIYERYARTARESIEACTLRAPRAGRVNHANSWYNRSRGVRTIEEGRSVYYSQAIFEIPDEHELKISFGLDETLVARAAPGMTVDVKLPGFEQSPVRAAVKSISNFPKQRWTNGVEIREYMVEALLYPTDEQRAQLHPQQDATVEITLTDDPQALVVPKDAVVRRNGRPCVLVPSADQSELLPLAVTPGEVHDGEVMILEGLTAGMQIVRHADVN